MRAGRFTSRLGSPAPAFLGVLLIVLAGACSDGGPGIVTPPPPPTPGSFVLVGAGDIALCGSPGSEATARLLDVIDGVVFTAGDNAYPSGTPKDFAECYAPTWGRHKDRTKPTPGNHDYETAGATGFYDYFEEQLGARNPGYYTYRVGPWRIIALNSEIGVGTSSGQYQWLKNELSLNVPCTLAIWHRPLFTSGPNLENADMRDIFRLLYDGNADVVVNGHDHLYERFAPQDANGRADSARGIREFIVGTGGIPLYDAGPRRPNSEVVLKTWGVLKLTLAEGGYSWDFIPVGSGSHDTGSGVCH